MGTSSTSEGTNVTGERTTGRQPRLPGYVDWLVAAVVALLGVVFGLGGASLFLLADVDAIREGVASGAIQSDVLTGEALVDATYATVWWSGVGLLVTGAALVVAAAGYLAYRRREERRLDSAGGRRRGVGTNAVVGAVAAVVLGFVPFSPVLGGFVSGYLQRGPRSSDLTAGGLSGLLATLPLVTVLLFTFGGLAGASVDAVAPGAALFVAAVVAGSVLFSVLFTVGLGVLGGYLGGRVAGDRPPTAPASEA
jgi:hypothetical protein